MRKVVFLAVCLFTACGFNPEGRFVAPLPSGISSENIENAFVPARFKVSDFNWDENTLTMEVLSEDLYDVVDVCQLSAGDTILYMGDVIVVDSIRRNGNLLEINGGLGEKGGAWLQAYEGGTWRAVQFDDHSVYSKVGKVKVPVSDDFVIVDCGEFYEDPYDTVRIDRRQYLETCRDYFFELNTRVLVEDGKVVSIERRWIP